MNDAFELYDLRVSVIGDPETFVCSHKLGDAFDVIGENLVFNLEKEFSLYALSALLPLLPAKQRITNPNDWMTTDAIIACPDPHCGAQFSIARLSLRTFKHSETTVVPLPESDDSNNI